MVLDVGMTVHVSKLLDYANHWRVFARRLAIILKRAGTGNESKRRSFERRGDASSRDKARPLATTSNDFGRLQAMTARISF